MRAITTSNSIRVKPRRCKALRYPSSMTITPKDGLNGRDPGTTAPTRPEGTLETRTCRSRVVEQPNSWLIGGIDQDVTYNLPFRKLQPPSHRSPHHSGSKVDSGRRPVLRDPATRKHPGQERV